MNNFGQAEHMKLATVLFQNLFPAINVNTVKLSNCRRVVLLNYVKETNTIQVGWCHPHCLRDCHAAKLAAARRATLSNPASLRSSDTT